MPSSQRKISTSDNASWQELWDSIQESQSGSPLSFQERVVLSVMISTHHATLVRANRRLTSGQVERTRILKQWWSMPQTLTVQILNKEELLSLRRLKRRLLHLRILIGHKIEKLQSLTTRDQVFLGGKWKSKRNGSQPQLKRSLSKQDSKISVNLRLHLQLTPRNSRQRSKRLMKKLSLSRPTRARFSLLKTKWSSSRKS